MAPQKAKTEEEKDVLKDIFDRVDMLEKRGSGSVNIKVPKKRLDLAIELAKGIRQVASLGNTCDHVTIQNCHISTNGATGIDVGLSESVDDYDERTIDL